MTKRVTQFGISTYGFRSEHIVPVAKHAEALGFAGVRLGEHIFEPVHLTSIHPYDEGKTSAPIVTSTRIERRRTELGRTAAFEFEVRVRGEPTRGGLRDYFKAGFDTLVIPNETIQGERGFEITLDQKFRRLDTIARALGIGR